MPTSPLDSAAHIVQLALTPVFLLAGVASLLNVFSTRLGRISDRVDALVDGQDHDRPDQRANLQALHLRSRALDVAVVLAALAGGLTCGAALVLFMGAVSNAGAAGGLYILFAGAIILTMGALAAFTFEVVLAGVGVRGRMDKHRNGTKAR